MELQDAVTLVTGAGGGIGAALAAEQVAAGFGGTADTTDVTDEAAVVALVERTLDAHGRIDLFCSNAGVFAGGGVEVDTCSTSPPPPACSPRLAMPRTR